MFDLIKDVERAVRKYPSLKKVELNREILVKGAFMAHNGAIEIEPYDIEIRFPKEYPHVFPSVYEVSNKIWPKDENRHVNPGGSLCLANPFDEAKLCKTGISLIYFIEAVLNPHLCREYAREKLGRYPTGERSHGLEGLWESFYEIFGTSEKQRIIKEYKMILEAKVGRNDPCCCGSGKKYKYCHESTRTQILNVGTAKAEIFYNVLKNNL